MDEHALAEYRARELQLQLAARGFGKFWVYAAFHAFSIGWVVLGAITTAYPFVMSALFKYLPGASSSSAIRWIEDHPIRGQFAPFIIAVAAYAFYAPYRIYREKSSQAEADVHLQNERFETLNAEMAEAIAGRQLKIAELSNQLDDRAKNESVKKTSDTIKLQLAILMDEGRVLQRKVIEEYNPPIEAANLWNSQVDRYLGVTGTFYQLLYRNDVGIEVTREGDFYSERHLACWTFLYRRLYRIGELLKLEVIDLKETHFATKESNTAEATQAVPSGTKSLDIQFENVASPRTYPQGVIVTNLLKTAPVSIKSVKVMGVWNDKREALIERPGLFGDDSEPPCALAPMESKRFSFRFSHAEIWHREPDMVSYYATAEVEGGDEYQTNLVNRSIQANTSDANVSSSINEPV